MVILVISSTQPWVQYQLYELQKKQSSYKKKTIRKSSTVEGMMYSRKNTEGFSDQMRQLNDIFKVMLTFKRNITPCCQLKNQK